MSKEMGYETRIVDGCVVTRPTTKLRKETPLEKSEIGTGRPVGEMTTDELRSFILTSRGFNPCERRKDQHE